MSDGDATEESRGRTPEAATAYARSRFRPERAIELMEFGVTSASGRI